MKERPILFNGDMVRAVLEGRKTQTRRVVKPQPLWVADPSVPFKTEDADPKGIIRCPYGQPGDRLWVRETFGTTIRSVGGTPHERFAYRATEPDEVYCYDCNGMELPMKWKPSIHMPRWASRIELEIVSVRVERLNEISEQDAEAEGVEQNTPGYLRVIAWKNYLSEETAKTSAKASFESLWQSVYGADSWAANPWVWVVEFKRVESSSASLPVVQNNG